MNEHRIKALLAVTLMAAGLAACTGAVHDGSQLNMFLADAPVSAPVNRPGSESPALLAAGSTAPTR
jgi:hypothetical protein